MPFDLPLDEVESLTAARKSALSGNEPSDAIRVVNALLTQIDHLRDYSNVLILTTSNITEAIDLAFVDRADIKQYEYDLSPLVSSFYFLLSICILGRFFFFSPFSLKKKNIFHNCEDSILVCYLKKKKKKTAF